MAFDKYGRPLCKQCGCYMRLTVIRIEEKRFGGKAVEFNCDQCNDNLITPLNILLAMRINNSETGNASGM